MPAHACDCVLLSMHVYLPVGHNHGSATSVSEERETIQKVSQKSRRKKPYAFGWVGVCVRDGAATRATYNGKLL